MHLQQIVAATDDAEAGRQAVRTALALAWRTGAVATVMRTVLPDEDRGASVEQLRRWVEANLPPLDPPPAIRYDLTSGIPGIEIPRFAERRRADLLVLGRTPRSRMARLLAGDTADAVARRSRLPCLFVTARETRIRRVLAAVDGSRHGATVLAAAEAFARQAGAELRVLTVEPVHAGEPAHLALAVPTAGRARLESQLKGAGAVDFEVRRGDAAEQILIATEAYAPDVLAMGCHRGGPAGVIEAGSTARRVIHRAPCAVLTVPL